MTTLELPPLFLPQTKTSVRDSDFRVVVVPASARRQTVAALQSQTNAASVGHTTTPHHSLLPADAPEGAPCIHVPSAGGREPPDSDGEPEGAVVGEALLEELRADALGGEEEVAVVVWRRFGGALLGVRSGGLQAAYRHAVREAVAVFSR